MKKIQREDIYLVSQHSDLTEKEINAALIKYVYADRQTWQKFLRIFFIMLGVGFMLSGLVFFFAYNWEDLSKFSKFGLTQLLLVSTTIIAILPRLNPLFKNITLCASVVLVGVLFAVFGQIYQTGANAYDFFLAWALFASLWVIISNFAPLWLFYIVLINTTLILYDQQVAKDWSFMFIITLLTGVNVLAILVAMLIAESNKSITIPKWFFFVLAIAVVTLLTIGITTGYYRTFEMCYAVLIFITLLLYALGIYYGYMKKSTFYLSIIPLSIIIMIAVLLAKLMDDTFMYLFVSLFITISITVVIKNLLYYQKKWSDE